MACRTNEVSLPLHRSIILAYSLIEHYSDPTSRGEVSATGEVYRSDLAISNLYRLTDLEVGELGHCAAES